MKVIFNTLFLLSVFFLLIMNAVVIIPCKAGIRSTSLTERSYIHTDREMYIAGDYLFFKIYVVDNPSLHLTGKSKLVYISIRNKDNHIIVNERINLINGMGHSSLYLPDTLTTGYYQLQAFTNCMRNEGEGSYYTKEIFISNRFDRELAALSEHGTYYNPVVQDSNNISSATTKIVEPLSIVTDKKIYHNREKISLSLKIDGTDLSTTANLSISVFEQIPQRIPNPGIDEYFKFTTNDVAVKLTNEVLSKNRAEEIGASSCKYLPEIDGQILQGKVIDAIDERIVPKAIVFLSTIDTTVNLKYTIIDSTRMFRFLLDSYYDNKELNFKVKSVVKSSQKFKILFDDKFAFSNGFTPAYFNDTSSLRNFISKSQNITKIHKVYHSKLNITDNLNNNLLSLNQPFAKVYTKPNLCVRPREYLSLPDFFEISTELIPNLRIRKKQGRVDCNFLDISANKYLDENPIIFLDGMLIDNVSQIIHLNSDQIDRIDCIGVQRALGNLTFDGILAIFTKKKEIDSIQVFNNTRFSVGYPLLPSKYYIPDYSITSDTNLPDYRQLLYWDPDVVLQGTSAMTCNFYASDESARYIIKVEGITSDGKTVNASTYINIESSEK